MHFNGSEPDLSKFEVLRGNLPALVAGLFVVWTTAAFGEELLVRGFILNELKNLLANAVGIKMAWFLALLASSVLSGLGHFYQDVAGVILTAVAGFGLVYLIRKRNLWASILTHGLYDTIAFFLVFSSYDKLMVSARF